jgi:hypothetical protein
MHSVKSGVALQVTFLGTSSAQPLLGRRNMSSLVVSTALVRCMVNMRIALEAHAHVSSNFVLHVCTGKLKCCACPCDIMCESVGDSVSDCCVCMCRARVL